MESEFKNTDRSYTMQSIGAQAGRETPNKFLSAFYTIQPLNKTQGHTYIKIVFHRF